MALWLGLLGLGFVTIGLELALRWRYGLGSPPLYVADPAIGYLLAPNQTLRRSGNRIAINAFSMRSGPIDRQPGPNLRRLLILGDSIVNGGWWTDQANTLSSLLETELNQAQFKPLKLNLAQPNSGQPNSGQPNSGQPNSSQPNSSQLNPDPPPFEVLNASANSWGPRNELAYLQRFGHFGAEAIVLIINTDDLFAAAPTSLPVGQDRAYPSRSPRLALLELAQRLLPNRPNPAIVAARQPEENCVELNRGAIGLIQAYAQDQGVPLILAMTPLKREVTDGPRDYEVYERRALSQWSQQRGLPYLDLLPMFKSLSQSPSNPSLYQDHIHLSAAGNRLVIDQLVSALRPYLTPSTQPEEPQKTPL
jgi:hypothetical protein